MNEKRNDNLPIQRSLHGITLETIVKQLVEQYGWAGLGDCIPIKCFNNDPSIKSSLKFLRKTPWAGKKVEYLYLKSMAKQERSSLSQKGTIHTKARWQ